MFTTLDLCFNTVQFWLELDRLGVASRSTYVNILLPRVTIEGASLDELKITSVYQVKIGPLDAEVNCEPLG